MDTMKKIYLAFLKNSRGVAAVEFALILPIFILLVFGAYGMFIMLQQNNRIDRASAMVSDLISREIEIDNADVDRFFDVSKALIGPLADDDSYKITLTSVFNEFDSAGDEDLSINWSTSNITNEKLTLEDLEGLTLPSVAEGDSIIIVTAEVGYRPTFLDGIVSDSLTFESIAVKRPRFVPLITLN